MPQPVRQRPGNERAYARGVAHYSRVYIAHAVLIVVGEGQRLQVAERRVAQISVHAYFYFQSDGIGIVIGNSRPYDSDEVNDYVPRQGVKCAAAHKMVKGVPLIQRQYDVHGTAEQAAHKHYGHGDAEARRKGQYFAYAEKGQSLIFFCFFFSLIHSQVKLNLRLFPRRRTGYRKSVCKRPPRRTDFRVYPPEQCVRDPAPVFCLPFQVL